MSVQSTQGFSFGLVANGVTLDLFKDEDIKVSDNVTGLFDLGKLPSDFTRQITLPGTRKNNDFFEHVYDISITNPFLFSTNQKVEAYIDFDGFYLASGYLQLDKVNVIGNKYIDSYEVSIYGTVSSFAREVNRSNLTDLNNLTEYNHTASMMNITSSWEGNLFDGDIVYPVIDYGKNLEYELKSGSFGINNTKGAMAVRDFKPSIRAKIIFDKIFDEYGFTYESDFMTSSIWDDIYLVCDNGLQYPIFNGVELGGYGQVKIGPISGSTTDKTLTAGVSQQLLWERTLEDPQGNMLDGGVYSYPRGGIMEGAIKIVVNVSGSAGVPQFQLEVAPSSNPSGTGTTIAVLDEFNQFFKDWDSSGNTGDVTHTLEQRFSSDLVNIAEDDYVFRLKYSNYNGSSFTVTLAPDGNEESYIQVNGPANSADLRIMEIARNLPFGERGIKQVDFIRGIQKKFNLVIYPSKTRPKHFIVETWKSWYKRAGITSFNNYINVNKKIEVIPANNLAVKVLQFGDTLGKDFLAQDFEKAQNRDYGTQYYVDNQNFFSQGELKVESTFSTSPLRYLPGTGPTGSIGLVSGFPQTVFLGRFGGEVCNAIDTIVYDANDAGVIPDNILYFDEYLTSPVTGYNFVGDFTSEYYSINTSTGQVGLLAGDCFGTS